MFHAFNFFFCRCAIVDEANNVIYSLPVSIEKKKISLTDTKDRLTPLYNESVYPEVRLSFIFFLLLLLLTNI